MRFALGLIRQARRPVPIRSRGAAARGVRMRDVEPRVEEWADGGDERSVGEPPRTRDTKGSAPAGHGRAVAASRGEDEEEARALEAGRHVGSQESRPVTEASVSSRPVIGARPGLVVRGGSQASSAGEPPPSAGAPERDAGPMARQVEVEVEDAEGMRGITEAIVAVSGETGTRLESPDTDVETLASPTSGGPAVAAMLHDATRMAWTPDDGTASIEPQPAAGADVAAPERAEAPTVAHPLTADASDVASKLARASTVISPLARGDAPDPEVRRPVAPEHADSGLAWLAARSFSLAEPSSDPSRSSRGARASTTAGTRLPTFAPASTTAAAQLPTFAPASAPTTAAAQLPSFAPAPASTPAAAQLPSFALERGPSPAAIVGGASHATTLPRAASLEAAAPRGAVPASRLLPHDGGLPVPRARRMASAAEASPVVRIGTIEVFMETQAPRDAVAQTLRRPDPPPWSSDLGRRFLRRF